jgi:hypothetical protein
MGNHIKATVKIPSCDFNNTRGVFMGNITQGGTVNHPEFPNPEADFNLVN